MRNTKAVAALIGSAGLAPATMAVLMITAAPAATAAMAGSTGASGQVQFVSDPGGYDNEQDLSGVLSGGNPAGGTGIDPGPSDVFDPATLGQRAGGTGVDTGPLAPPDTPSGPTLADGGQPAGAIG